LILLHPYIPFAQKQQRKGSNKILPARSREIFRPGLDAALFPITQLGLSVSVSASFETGKRKR
jgi:hypothetical protein